MSRVVRTFGLGVRITLEQAGRFVRTEGHSGRGRQFTLQRGEYRPPSVRFVRRLARGVQMRGDKPERVFCQRPVSRPIFTAGGMQLRSSPLPRFLRRSDPTDWNA